MLVKSGHYKPGKKQKTRPYAVNFSRLKNVEAARKKHCFKSRAQKNNNINGYIILIQYFVIL